MKDHAAIVIRDQDKVLFIKRSEKKKTLPNIWAFPSGTREEHENIEETCCREALEELGVKVKVENILTTRDLPEFSVRLHFIVCTIVEGKPTIKDADEIAKIEWLSFPEFFNKYNNTQIGHGLIFLRENPHIWTEHF